MVSCRNSVARRASSGSENRLRSAGLPTVLSSGGCGSTGHLRAPPGGVAYLSRANNEARQLPQGFVPGPVGRQTRRRPPPPARWRARGPLQAPGSDTNVAFPASASFWERCRRREHRLSTSRMSSAIWKRPVHGLRIAAQRPGIGPGHSGPASADQQTARRSCRPATPRSAPASAARPALSAAMSSA